MIKDEKVVVLTDRVRKLTEELNEKKAHFQQISKDCFSVHQDYQTKSTYLKELKSKAAKKLKDYVKIVTDTALQDSDSTYKEYILQKKTELAADLLEDKYLTLHNLRKSLEDAVQMYTDCRRNLKKYQFKLSAVTDEARIDTLNMVAFCRYSQSVIATEVQKLPTSSFLPSKKVSDTKNTNFNHCSKSAKELTHFYIERIAKLRRDEMLLANRISTSLNPYEAESQSTVVDPRPQSSTNMNNYSRAQTPLSFNNSRTIGQRQGNGNDVSSPVTNPATSMELSVFSSQSDGSDDDKKLAGNKKTRFPPISQEADPLTKKGKKKKKTRSKSHSVTAALFDKAKFAANLFAAVGVRVDDLPPSSHSISSRPPPQRHEHTNYLHASSGRHHHHGRVSEQQPDPAVEHTLKENSLLQRDRRISEQDRKLAQLAVVMSALEGKHRELFCIKEVRLVQW